MTRPLRIQYPGAIHHVIARGNARQPIFRDTIDRECFFQILAKVIERHHWACHAYCLMANHYHLLLQTMTGDLSGGMRQLNGVYTQRFNRRHRRVGHLLQGRFKSVLVQRDVHLLELSRYVVLNPVRAGLVDRPEQYPWTSYAAAAGLAPAPKWLSCRWLLSQFAGTPHEQRSRYRSFVLAALPDHEAHDDRRPSIVGSEAFAKRHRRYLEPKREAAEFTRGERFADRPSLESLLRACTLDSRDERNRALRRAHAQHGYSAAEIGRALGLHPSTISKLVNAPTPEGDSRFKT